MPTSLSDTSIIRPPAIFGGASSQDFTKRCSLGLFQSDEDTGTGSVYFVSDYPGGIRFKFGVESTGQSMYLPEDAIMRLVCHAMLEHLPKEALGDAWVSLNDAWEWYGRPLIAIPKANELANRIDAIFDPVDEEPFSLTED